MTEIYLNDSLKIFQDKNDKTMYKIELYYISPSLLRSLIKTGLIKGGTITDDYKSLRFKALSVKSFAKYKEDHSGKRGSSKLSINVVSQILESLIKQLNYLILYEHKTILGYTPDNIIVINDTIFAYLVSDLIADINPKDNLAIISCPFNVKDFYVSPEMLRIKVLPSYIHYKTAYFSLGFLILNAVIEEENLYIEYLKEYIKDDLKEKNGYVINDKIKEYLNQLHFKDTKLYWLLSRCLVEDPEKRSIQLI
jgi:hypothetical protein